MGELTGLVSDYLERVVNQRDLGAVDRLVALDYSGSGPGWPTTLEALRRYYADLYRERPDWRIEVVDAVELGQHVVLRAIAQGHVLTEELPRPRRLEWLIHYRVVDGRIRQMDVLEVVQRQADSMVA